VKSECPSRLAACASDTRLSITGNSSVSQSSPQIPVKALLSSSRYTEVSLCYVVEPFSDAVAVDALQGFTPFNAVVLGLNFWSTGH